MTWTDLEGTGIAAVTALLVLAAGGCDLLDVTDPTALEEEQLDNARGAALLRGDALGEFYRAFGAHAWISGVLTDEFTIYQGDNFPLLSNSVDRRDATSGPYTAWQTVRRAATVAFSKLERFGPDAHAGEMLALRGQATLRLAADFCPGFPLFELDGFTPVIGSPVTTEQAYERALEDFDAAVAVAADSARVLSFAQLGRAAALLGLGRFSQAASAAADVPTDYRWNARYVNEWTNPLVFAIPFAASTRISIADREGGNGLDFLSAGDPRAQVREYGIAEPPWGTGEPLYNPAMYADSVAPIAVASGIEARLIEAEAALAEGDAAWLSILNDLRATQVDPSLPPLDDPGTPDSRLDLLFRERAFWLFASGKRLADLVRLVRLYGRDPESVLPTGEYHQHGLVYGTTVTFPFDPSAEPLNPAVTGCTGR